MPFGLKTGLDFAYLVWFSRELRECMNVFIINFLSQMSKKERKICKFEMDFKKPFCCRSNLSTIMIRFSAQGAY